MAQRQESLDELIARTLRQSSLRELEGKDVLQAVDTPYVTSDSDDEPTVFQDGEWNLAQQLLRTTVIPSYPCEYSALYNDEAYQRRARLKLHNVKESFKVRTRQEIMDLMDSQDYQETMQYLYQTYPEHGGREDLYHLVAMYMFHLEEGGIDSDDNDDDDNDDDDNDNDNDDGNGNDKDNDNDDGNGDKENRGNDKMSDRKRKSSADIMSRPLKTIRF